MTDEELRLSVEDLLTSEPLLDASKIEVVAELGFISLNGFVQSKEQMLMAEKIVKEVPEVKDVFNYLSIRPKSLFGEQNLYSNII